MKKLISILLSAMMLVSLLAVSTLPVAADEEKQYTMSAIVMLYPEDPYDDYCITRFIFNWTEADNAAIPEGFEAWWGTGAVSDSFEYYTAQWFGDEEWKWDEKGNMSIDVCFDLPYMDAGEEYNAAKKGELQGYICDLGNGGEFVHDDNGRSSVFDLVPNFTMTENQYRSGLNNNAIVLTIQDEETYYGTEHAEITDPAPVTKPVETEPKETEPKETKPAETKAAETKAASSETDAEEKTSSMSTGAIIGIVAAAVVIIGATLALVLGGKKK